jgi:hypothetical protein
MPPSAPAENDTLPELVLLLTDPLAADAAFFRSAYEDVLGLTLSGGTEFVKGDFPSFMFQSAGILMSVWVGNRQYGDPYFHSVFPHHDLRAIRSSLGFLAGRRLRKHQGWISACLIREEQSTGLDPYVHLGRALYPFALPGAAVGLIAPVLRRAVLFSPEHAQLLRTGDIRQIFSLSNEHTA